MDLPTFASFAQQNRSAASTCRCNFVPTCLILSVVKSNSSWAERPICAATHMRWAQQWKFRPSRSKNVAHSFKSSASADLDQ